MIFSWVILALFCRHGNDPDGICPPRQAAAGVPAAAAVRCQFAAGGGGGWVFLCQISQPALQPLYGHDCHGVPKGTGTGTESAAAGLSVRPLFLQRKGFPTRGSLFVSYLPFTDFMRSA